MEGFTVWFTELPPAGKSILVRLLAAEFGQRGCRAELLDWDERYRKALAGGLPNFTGVSDPDEESVHPEVMLETDKEPPEASIRRLTRLEEPELIAADGVGTRGWEGPLRDTALVASDPNAC